jgi:hypothetical protein
MTLRKRRQPAVCTNSRTSFGGRCLSRHGLNARVPRQGLNLSPMKAGVRQTDHTALAASIAPEDVRCGSYVAVLNEIVELPPWLCCGPAVADDPVRVRYRAMDAGVPLKVLAVCLPFVCAKSADGQLTTLDIRQVELVRLEEHYARTVWKAQRSAGSRRRAASTG